MTAQRGDAGRAETVILCGPPKGCTCPAVAWWCICGARPDAVPPLTEEKKP